VKFPDFTLTGQFALITGAGQGLGRGLALAMANAGADIGVADLPTNLAAAEETAAEVAKLGRQARVIPVDVTVLPSITTMVEEMLAAFGKIDILVNNAGVNVPKLALEVTERDWDRVLDVDLKGLFFCSQAVGRHMTQRGYGKIINIASQVGVVGYRYRAAYCSAKAGVVNLTRVLAIEWAEYGVNVNAIGPTFLRTPFTEPMFQNEEFYRDVLSRIPLQRIGEVDDVLGAAVFLASHAADMVTGHTLLVDGGWTSI
jgi:2-deoxy-D-gluconate 3-dehydrogenase